MNVDRPPDAVLPDDRARPPSSDSVRGRFAYLDGIRGLAILGMVVYELHHHGIVAAGGALGRFLDEGSRGLDLFFVVSGFALAYPALSVLRADGRVGFDLGRYAVRRLARVLPAAWLVVTILLFAPALATLAHPSLPAFERALPAAGPALREYFFLEVPPRAPDAFWVVAVALRWYLLFPALLLLWTRSQRAFFAVLAAIVILDPLTHLHGLGLGALPAFMLGVVAADWRVRHFGFARWAPYLAIASALIGLALEQRMSGPLFAFAPFPADNLGWEAAAFFLVAAAGFGERAERAAGVAPLAVAGTASFAVALAIEPAIALATPLARRLSTLADRAAGRLPARDALAHGLEVAIVGCAVAAAGFALYRLVDRGVLERDPRMRLADRMEPALVAVFRLLRTTGIVVLGRTADEPSFEARPAGATAFYAPPPRGENLDVAGLEKKAAAEPHAERDLIATKKRLADRTSALFADAEYERNRELGIVTPPPSPSGFVMAPPPLPETNGTVYGESRDVWQKPRAVPTPPLAPSVPVVFETHPGGADAPVTRPRSVEAPAPATTPWIKTAPIRFKIGRDEAPPASSGAEAYESERDGEG